ncbi:MAG: RNase adapter RapZ [Alphaproteobacteria bacterium]|nr:RNase adapter RapZ [Alphaproteobacteria bacterium]
MSDDSSARGARGDEPVRVILITGMSGAGKSSALRVLEDLGFEAIDNMPVHFIEALLTPGTVERRPLALGIDIRTRDFAPEEIERILRQRGRADLALQLIFVDADDDTLQRRFTETRRRHPLAGDRPVSEGIAAERAMISALRDRADLVIDTSRLNIVDFRALLSGHFERRRGQRLAISVTSFAYRRGLPHEADLVLDVRLLRNPHYDPALRQRTGLESEVGAYIAADPAFAPFLERLSGLVLSLLPGYGREGKSYLAIAIGCTGGRHRSVYVAECLAAAIHQAGWRVTIRHRDLNQGLPTEERIA